MSDAAEDDAAAAVCRCWQFAAERSLTCADCSEDSADASHSALDRFYAEFLGATASSASPASPASPLVDSHCHLQLFPSHRDAALRIQRACSLGQLSHMVVCGVTPLEGDWARVAQLHGEHPQRVVPCFGLHPAWIAAFEDAGARR
eukprot:gene10282-7303_t